MILCTTWARPTLAQAPAQTSPPPPAVSLDLAALVSSPDVFPGRVDDPVWQLEPQPGRWLLQLPIRVEPPTGGRGLEIDRPPIDVRGARFVTWRIVPPNPESGDDPDAVTDASQRPGGIRGLLGIGDDDGVGGPDGAGAMTRPDAAQSLPANAPRLTRDLLVRPDGTIHWDLERLVPGAAVKDAGQGYALKLKPELLAAMEPARPGPVNVSGDLRAAQAERRVREVEYRRAMRAFLDLRREVRDLPEEFTVPLPPRLWAVLELREGISQLTITGPESAQLPSTIRLSSLEAMRAVASGARDGAGGEHIRQLTALARGGDALTHRAIALALDQAGIIGQVQLNDSLYQLLQTIINGPDAEARQVVVIALATSPPSGATAVLLRDAASRVSPRLQLLSLRGLFRGDTRDITQLRDMLTNVNRALADQTGPDAGLVLEAMVEGTADSRSQDDAAAAAMITGVDFETLSPARRDQAIAYVIRAAGTRPLAAAWLNHRLLGSAQPELSRRTLELLARAGGSAGRLEPLANALIDLVSRPADDADDQPVLDLTLSAPIALDSVNHSLFRGINSGDPAIRELAWRALRNFSLGDPRRMDDEAAVATGGDVTMQLLTAALSRRPTPPSLATFFANGPTHPRGTRGLIELVLYGDAATAAKAAGALVGRRLDLTPALRLLPPAQRAEFGARLYEALRGEPMLVTGLLADPAGDGLLQWFSAQVGAGDLPEPVEWAARYGGDEALLRLAASSGPHLPDGAVAALVAAAGGSPADAAALVQRFAALGDRSVAGLTTAWGPAKRAIYARRLGEAAGTYRLILRTWNDQFAFARPGQAPANLKTINVGIVELTADGQSVYLGNHTVNFAVPSERLALRMTARDLKNLPDEQLAALPLEDVEEPIDLLPQDDGSWQGQATLPDGSTLQVELQPVTTAP